jgi:type IV secretion system protein VirB9
MNRKPIRVLSVGVAAMVMFSRVPAAAEDQPQSFVTDNRVKTFIYSENQVYKLVAYYGYQTDVQLAADEELKTISAGDSAGFQITPADGGRHIFIKPMARGARTNLSVITSKRIYVFDLSARAVVETEAITYFVRFQYPQTGWLGTNRPHPGKSPNDLHFDYAISGAKTLQPVRVFDDGQFTFFQFDEARDLPAIFVVGADGKESLINYRMEDGYVVVERVGDFFTLRSGKLAATVINQRRMSRAKV